MSGDAAPFDRAADEYDTLYRDNACKAEDCLMVEKLADVVRGAQVLDVGCGTGWVADHCPEIADYHGFDISTRMLERGRAKHPEHLWTYGDMSVPWPKIRPYDAVVSLWCAPNYSTMEHFAASAFGRLESGGRVFAVPHGPAAREGDGVRHDSYLPSACYNGATGYAPWTYVRAKRAFEHAGFRDVTVETFRSNFELPARLPVFAHTALRRIERVSSERAVFFIVQGVK